MYPEPGARLGPAARNTRHSPPAPRPVATPQTPLAPTVGDAPVAGAMEQSPGLRRSRYHGLLMTPLPNPNVKDAPWRGVAEVPHSIAGRSPPVRRATRTDPAAPKTARFSS